MMEIYCGDNVNAVEGNFEEGTNPGYSDVTRKRCGDNRIRKTKRFMTHVRGVWFGTFSVLGAGKKMQGSKDSILVHCMLGQGIPPFTNSKKMFAL